MRSVRVLGIDPGLTRCGIGLVDGGPGTPLRMVTAGVVRTPAEQDLEKRLLAIDTALEELVVEHRPDVMAIERVFSQQNVSTAMGVAQASGVAMVVAARHGIAVRMHTPSEVKAAITGSGRADKAQVGHMVARVLGLNGPPKPADTADALAIAVCQIWRGDAHDRLLAATGRKA